MAQKKSYAALKAAAREQAIDWQEWQSEQNLSYGELNYWMAHFERLARRFGLVREFRENAVIG